jgi:hypothetical protein
VTILTYCKTIGYIVYQAVAWLSGDCRCQIGSAGHWALAAHDVLAGLAEMDAPPDGLRVQAACLGTSREDKREPEQEGTVVRSTNVGSATEAPSVCTL